MEKWNLGDGEMEKAFSALETGLIVPEKWGFILGKIYCKHYFLCLVYLITY